MPFCISNEAWVCPPGALAFLPVDPDTVQPYAHNGRQRVRGSGVEAYKEAVAQCLAEPLGQPPEAIVALLRIPPEPAWGDYALPCFALAKAWRQAPTHIAAQLAQ